jgi:O-antigen/teichoic acid export membrane protein
MGFSSAIMHKVNLERKEFCSLYWIQLSVYSIIYLIVYSISGVIASFYKQELLSLLVPLIMLNLLFYGIGKLYDTLLQKNMQFKLMAIRNIISCIISLFIAVILAYRGCGVYSLVFSTISQALILNLWNFIAGQKCMKICFAFDLKNNLELIKIGAYQTGSQILNYLSHRLDTLILGKLVCVDDLGIYNLAKEFVFKLMSLINSIVNKVILPVFASIQSDINKSRAYYCMLIKCLSLVNYLCYCLILINSDIIVNILYGKSYEQVAPIMAILCIWGMLACVGNPNGNIVIAFGRTNLSFRYTLVRIILCLPLSCLFALYGLIITAYGQIFMMAISIVLSWYIILRPVIKLKLSEWSQSFLPLLFVTLFLCVCGYVFNKYLNVDLSIKGYVVVNILTIILYIAFAYLIHKKDISSILLEFRSRRSVI